MKTLSVLTIVVLIAAASKKPVALSYRNLFKTPIGEIKPNLRIIKGREAEPHSIPSQAFLEIYSHGQSWYCGGSLISQNYVLTAAHCVKGVLEVHVILGAHKPFENENTQILITSSEIKIHEDYDPVWISRDVALIKLPEPVIITPAIKPVSLPRMGNFQYDYVNVTARMSGWELTKSSDSKPSDVLNYADVRVITNEECYKYFHNSFDSSVLCTVGTSFCTGDSGGPLIVEGTQIGILSFGTMYCLPDYPSGFSRISSFLDWLRKNSDAPINF